jgi:Na+-translocating ferredoxin:NAD+ oxidoreductase RnfA subunit
VGYTIAIVLLAGIRESMVDNDVPGPVQGAPLVLFAAALVNNVVLSQFLGICSFVGVSNKIKTSFSLGMAVIFVLTIASAVANLLYTLFWSLSDWTICRPSYSSWSSPHWSSWWKCS